MNEMVKPGEQWLDSIRKDFSDNQRILGLVDFYEELRNKADQLESVRYEAATSGLRYTNPRACGEVVAIHIDGVRWDIKPAAPEGMDRKVIHYAILTEMRKPGFDLLSDIEQAARVYDAMIEAGRGE